MSESMTVRAIDCAATLLGFQPPGRCALPGDPWFLTRPQLLTRAEPLPSGGTFPTVPQHCSTTDHVLQMATRRNFPCNADADQGMRRQKGVSMVGKRQAPRYRTVQCLVMLLVTGAGAASVFAQSSSSLASLPLLPPQPLLSDQRSARAAYQW